MKTRTLTTVLILAATVAFNAACGTDDPRSGGTTTLDTTPTTTPADAGWSATAALCSDTATGPGALGAGGVAAVTDTDLTAGACLTLDGDPIELDDGSHYAIGIGADRDDIELGGVSGEPAQLLIFWDRAGPNCAVTAEFRGALIAVATGPADAATPTALVTPRDHDC